MIKKVNQLNQHDKNSHTEILSNWQLTKHTFIKLSSQFFFNECLHEMKILYCIFCLFLCLCLKSLTESFQTESFTFFCSLLK